jgi:hypothetical protein
MLGRSNLLAFLVIGLLIGGLAGYMTRPEETAEIKLGPLSVEVRNNEGRAAVDRSPVIRCSTSQS